MKVSLTARDTGGDQYFIQCILDAVNLSFYIGKITIYIPLLF